MKFDREMMAALRKAGFRRTWLMRHQDGHVTEYERWDETRLVSVQLWQDGNHRASNMLIMGDDRRRLCGSTLPTDFRTTGEMMAAIETEATRTDHKS